MNSLNEFSYLGKRELRFLTERLMRAAGDLNREGERLKRREEIRARLLSIREQLQSHPEGDARVEQLKDKLDKLDALLRLNHS